MTPPLGDSGQDFLGLDYKFTKTFFGRKTKRNIPFMLHVSFKLRDRTSLTDFGLGNHYIFLLRVNFSTVYILFNKIPSRKKERVETKSPVVTI